MQTLPNQFNADNAKHPLLRHWHEVAVAPDMVAAITGALSAQLGSPVVWTNESAAAAVINLLRAFAILAARQSHYPSNPQTFYETNNVRQEIE